MQRPKLDVMVFWCVTSAVRTLFKTVQNYRTVCQSENLLGCQFVLQQWNSERTFCMVPSVRAWRTSEAHQGLAQDRDQVSCWVWSWVLHAASSSVAAVNTQWTLLYWTLHANKIRAPTTCLYMPVWLLSHVMFCVGLEYLYWSQQPDIW